ncbi:MAG TPA: thioesterase domain-containing protein [Xanthobacteraceae bacterium]|jgi:pimeloyl-ACP methyl ester carboxylesterase|nr:thioesterase domain-containing protein [Xanthobacteraceae bacterium]
MKRWSRFAAIGVIAIAILAIFGMQPAAARAHVYLFRGLADVYSLGMNTLADELNARGVYATAHSHTDWKQLADQAAAAYKAGKEGPIILIGHSLGADAVMQMADYLGDKSVPVALVVPVDGTQSFAAPGNVARVINFTQRDYAYMRAGPGFRGSLSNVDLSHDPGIDHLTIDKSPRMHTQVIAAVLAIVGGQRSPVPDSAKQQAGKPAGKDDHTPIAPTAADAPRPDATTTSATPPLAAPAAPPQPAPQRAKQVDQIPD